MTRAELITNIEKGNFTLSHTSLQEFAKSPAHFIQYKLGEKEQTRSMLFGSFSHAIVFEPDTLETKYAVAPECDRRTKEGKALWADFCEANAGKEIITAKENETAKIIQDALFSNRASRWLLDQVTETEKPVKWTYDGFSWRGYIDGCGDGIIVDLKILADATPRKVEKSIRYDGYARQAVHYRRGFDEGVTNYLIAADHSGNVCAAEIGYNVLKQAAKEIDYYLARFNECILMGSWDMSYDFYCNDEHGIFKINN